MNRREYRESKRRKIGKVSRRLFLKKGYENTTIRQIIKEVGMSTGSLYNFFENKEDILLNVYKGILQEFNTLTDKISDEFREPLLRFSMSIALQVSVVLENERLLGVYMAAFGSEAIDEFVLRYRTKRLVAILNDSDLDFSYDEILHRNLAINGAVKAVIEWKVKGRIVISLQDIYSLIIRMGLSALNVPGERTDNIIQQTIRIMDSKGAKFKRDFLDNLSKDLK